MSLGQGNISFTNKPAAAAASVAGARNGLSVAALLNAVLGQDVGEVGDPGALISNREIPLAGFSLNFLGIGINLLIDDAANSLFVNDGAANNFFTIDPGGNYIQLGDNSGTYDGMALSFYGGGYLDLGDTNSVTNNTIFYIDDSIGQFGMFSTLSGGHVLKFTQNTGRYELGQINGGNSTYLVIDDTVEEFIFSSAGNNSFIRMNGVLGFTGTVTPVNSITVNGGIVTAVS